MLDPEDLVTNPSPNASFDQLLAANPQRRRLLKGGLSAAVLGFLGAQGARAARSAAAATATIGFRGFLPPPRFGRS